MNDTTVELHEHKWCSTLRDYIDVVEQSLKEQGIDDPRVRAFKCVSALCQYHGGMQHYLPKGDALKRALRDISIAKDFTGCNHKELAQKHGLTEKQIYEIIAKYRKEQQNKKQFGLFDGVHNE